MHDYRIQASRLLEEILLRVRALDALSEACRSHRLSKLEPLARRLEAIAFDLQQENRLRPAMVKVDDLIMRLIGNSELTDPAYRSLVAGVLARCARRKGSPHAKLGGLRGGRPRKDGQPVRTLESKGYGADCLPPIKAKGMRQHPALRERLQALVGADEGKELRATNSSGV